MDRICEKPKSIEAIEKWTNLVPNVFRAAELEKNSKIIEFLRCTDNYSGGTYIIVIGWM